MAGPGERRGCRAGVPSIPAQPLPARIQGAASDCAGERELPVLPRYCPGTVPALPRHCPGTAAHGEAQPDPRPAEWGVVSSVPAWFFIKPRSPACVQSVSRCWGKVVGLQHPLRRAAFVLLRAAW